MKSWYDSVCNSSSNSVSVCLSILMVISQTMQPIFTKFLWALPVAMAQSSAGVAIHHVLPVLWVMSHFHRMGPISLLVTSVSLCDRNSQKQNYFWPVGMPWSFSGDRRQHVTRVESDACVCLVNNYTLLR